MPTNDERRKIAAELRENRDPLTPYNLVDYIFDDPWNHDSGEEVAARLADLIEPEERTCHIEPLSLREFFAGEKYVLTSEAMESAEDERFDSLSRELEADARFTCSSCHVLFGTHEVANADYDILEDGTYEVSGVAPIIKFCPNCGAKVIQE